MPQICSADRASPDATPTSTGTRTEVDEIGATTPMTPVERAW
jgi:hypothetical protein